MESVNQNDAGAARSARSELRDHWVLSCVEGSEGQLVSAVSNGPEYAEAALLAAVGANAFLWEELALAFLYLAAPEKHPDEVVA